MDYIKNLKKLLKHKSDNADNLNYHFKSNCLKRNNIKVKCILTGESMKINGFYCGEKKRSGLVEPYILYFFGKGKNSFYLVLLNDYHDSLILCNYYNIGKCLSLTESKKFKKQCAFFKNYIPKQIKVKNNQLIGCLLGIRPLLKNPHHYLWEVAFLISKSNNLPISQFIKNNFYNEIDLLHLNKFFSKEKKIKFIGDGSNLGSKKNKNFLNKINGIPFSLTGCKKIEFINDSFVNGLSKVIGFNNKFIKNNSMFENSNDHIKIYIHLKNNRRLCINFLEYIFKIIDNLIEIYKEKIYFIIGGAYISEYNSNNIIDNNLLTGEASKNYEDFLKIESYINNKYNLFKNYKSVIGYPFLNIIKNVGNINIFIGQDGSGVNDYITMLSPNCLYFDFGVAFKYQNDNNYLYLSTETFDSGKHSFNRFTFRDKDLRKNMYFFNTRTFSERKGSKWEIPNIDYVIKFIIKKVMEKHQL